MASYKVTLISGSVGFVLTCVGIPTSDCTIETHAKKEFY